MRKKNTSGQHRLPQTFLQKVKRRHPVARLLLAVILAFTAIGAVPTSSKAAGVYTHELAAIRAIDRIEFDAPKLAELLRRHPDALASGARFPDWGNVEYMKYAKYGDGAHYGSEFELAYDDYLSRTLTWPWDTDEERSIAFLFGLVSHQVVDSIFHDVYQLNAERGGDFNALAETHYTIEMGVDAFHLWDQTFLQWDGWIPRLVRRPDNGWWFPTQAILAAYASPKVDKGPEVSQAELHRLLHDVYREDSFRLTGAEYSSIVWYLGVLPYSRDNYSEPKIGGMPDMVEATAQVWLEMWCELAPVTAVTVTPVVPAAGNGLAQGPVTVHLHAQTPVSSTREIWYALNNGAPQKYSGPFTLATEGNNQVAVYSFGVRRRLNFAKTPTDTSMKPIQMLNIAVAPPPDGTSRPAAARYPHDGTNAVYHSPVTVGLHAASPLGSDMVTTWYALNSGQYQQYTGPFTIADEGATHIAVYSVGQLGNHEAVRELTLNIDSQGTTPEPSPTPTPTPTPISTPKATPAPKPTPKQTPAPTREPQTGKQPPAVSAWDPAHYQWMKPRPIGNIVTCMRPHDSWIKIYRWDGASWIKISDRGFGPLSPSGYLKVDGLEPGAYRVELWANGKLITTVGDTAVGDDEFRVYPYRDNYTPWACPAP